MILSALNGNLKPQTLQKEVTHTWKMWLDTTIKLSTCLFSIVCLTLTWKIEKSIEAFYLQGCKLSSGNMCSVVGSGGVCKSQGRSRFSVLHIEQNQSIYSRSGVKIGLAQQFLSQE